MTVTHCNFYNPYVGQFNVSQNTNHYTEQITNTVNVYKSLINYCFVNKCIIDYGMFRITRSNRYFNLIIRIASKVVERLMYAVT